MDREEAFEFLDRTARGIAEMFGSTCETLVHDMSVPEHPILSIYNGHVSGRGVGSTMDILGVGQELDQGLAGGSEHLGDAPRSPIQKFKGFFVCHRTFLSLRQSFLCYGNTDPRNVNRVQTVNRTVPDRRTGLRPFVHFAEKQTAFAVLSKCFPVPGFLFLQKTGNSLSDFLFSPEFYGKIPQFPML